MKRTPKVSVLMSVYNDACYLREAVDSILSQTFTDFEFIIVNDGSTDGTAEILNSYNDERIVLLTNEKNLGLIRSLNRGLAIARGEYVARFDANDVARSDRLELQVRYLDTHPDVALVSSWFAVLDAEERIKTIVQLPSEPQEIASVMLYQNCICHTSAMFRRKVVGSIGGYREHWEAQYGCTGAEDRDLWFRILNSYELANVPQPLVSVRRLNEGLSVAKRMSQKKVLRLVLQEAMQRRRAGIGPPVSPLAAGRHHLFVALQYLAEKDPVGCREELRKAIAANPDFLSDRDHIARKVAGLAVELSHPPLSQFNPRHGVVFIEQFFQNLPLPVVAWEDLKNHALSLYWIASAFNSFEHRNWRGVRAAIPKGIARNPRWLGNRGVISILIRSLFPAHLRGT